MDSSLKKKKKTQVVYYLPHPPLLPTLPSFHKKKCTPLLIFGWTHLHPCSSVSDTKNTINSVFQRDRNISCDEQNTNKLISCATEGASCDEQYTNKLISSTTDFASVNTGLKEGLLTRLEEDGREWLVCVYCVNHCVELAVKDAMGREFDSVEKMYMDIFS